MIKHFSVPAAALVAVIALLSSVLQPDERTAAEESAVTIAMWAFNSGLDTP